MSELIEFWNDLGFLDGVEEEKKERLSREYQKAADFLMENGDKINENLEVMFFPIIRRIVSSTDRFTEIDIYKVIDLFPNCQKRAEKICATDSHIDKEAEICLLISEEYIEKYGNNNFNDTNKIKL